MNTNAKHTPGPWTVIDAITTKERYHIATDNAAPYASMIAHLHGTDPKHGDKEANARLIAAAPALADVARTASTLAERIRQELIRAGFSGPSISDLRDLADAAAAAIAQAEGRANA